MQLRAATKFGTRPLSTLERQMLFSGSPQIVRPKIVCFSQPAPIEDAHLSPYASYEAVPPQALQDPIDVNGRQASAVA